MLPLLGGLTLAGPAAPKLQLHPHPHGIYPPPASPVPLLHISLGLDPGSFSTDSILLFILLVLYYSSLRFTLCYCIVIFFILFLKILLLDI